MRIFILVAIVLCAIPLPADDLVVIEAAASVKKSEIGDHYVANLELGDLPLGQMFKLRLELINPLPNEIAVSRRPIVHCSCLDFESEVDVLPAEGSANFEMKIRTSNKTRISVPDVKTEFSLTKPDQTTEVVKVVLNYRLQGVLAFDRSNSLLELGRQDQQGEFFLPIVFTNPVVDKNLKFKLSKELEGIVCETTLREDRQFLRVLVPSALIANGPVSGNISVVDTLTDKSCAISVTAKTIDDFVVSPRIIRFRKRINSEHYEASVIVRRRKPATSSGAEDENSVDDDMDKLFATANVDGYSIQTNVMSLGSTGSVFRIKLRATETKSAKPTSEEQADVIEFDELDQQIRFQFRINGKSSGHTMSAMFLAD